MNVLWEFVWGVADKLLLGLYVWEELTTWAGSKEYVSAVSVLPQLKKFS